MTIKTNPLVTIITVCYNSETTIKRCIESVIKQTYPNIEYIIIDGLSTDKTSQIVRSYNEKISAFISEKDSGISEAFNKGIKIAKGEFIQILNSDDFIPPDKIAKSVALLLANPKYSFIHGDVIIVTNNGSNFKIRGDKHYHKKLKYYMPRINHPSFLVKRTTYLNIGGFDQQIRIAMDYDWIRRLGLSEIGLYSSEIIVYMQDGGASRRNVLNTFKEEKSISIRHGDQVLNSNLIYYYRIFKFYLKKGLEIVFPARILNLFKQGKEYDI